MGLSEEKITGTKVEIPAIEGGIPVRNEVLPYGKQSVEDSDVNAVIDVLHSDWLTTGPAVREFEQALAQRCSTTEAIAVSSGTAALHCAMFALGIGRDDEVIVPALTFAATANVVLYCNAKPVFTDVDSNTLLIDPISVAEKITPKTKAVIAVDYTGLPCDYDALAEICEINSVHLVADACHSIGGSYKGKSVGSLAELSAFSFHPVKHMTTGEGGAVTTDNEMFAGRVRTFRNHGIAVDHHQKDSRGTHGYDMSELGFNYRISDIACALGRSQLVRLDASVHRRREIAAQYDAAFNHLDTVSLLGSTMGAEHARHLYILRLNIDTLKTDRDGIFRALRAEGIGVNVHYRPVYRHSYYRTKLGYPMELCPVAEDNYQRIITLPLFQGMSDQDVADVIVAVDKALRFYQR